jgi:NCAIR mutase (PurE)-related protein
VSRRPARVRRAPDGEHRVGGYARLDHGRPARVGVPEVVLAEGKAVAHLLGIVAGLHERGRGALISRTDPKQRLALRRWAHAHHVALAERAGGRLVRLPGPLGVTFDGGVVALLAAGTSDVPCAEEARAVLMELGIRPVVAYDVGVAGLHRLFRALTTLRRHRPRAWLVFAGREGALPTVVAGLVRGPVVGIPTSVGYGRGGRGEAALNAMLQSCAPIAVVNIDGAVPAALFAAQIFAGAPPNRGSSTRRRRGAK